MALGRLARCTRSVLHDPRKGPFCAIKQSGWTEHSIEAKRNLLSEDVVKLQDFQQTKLDVARQVTGSKGNYIELLSQKLQKNERILTEELRFLLHLCQSEDDMMTARDAIYRYHAENRSSRTYGEYKFGPLFMRLCYELGLEDMAAATLTDKSMKGFFNDSTSFNIAIDMLFTKGSYENALEILRDMKNQGVPFNMDTLKLASGTCYKLNTPESYRICSTLLEEARSVPRHAYCFAVALALRQNDVEKAWSLYSQIVNKDSRICQNLKVVLLAMSGEVQDAISMLSGAMLPKSPHFVKKLDFSQEVVDLLRVRSEDGHHAERVQQMVSQLEKAGQVTQQTLDDMLCHTPTGKRKPIIMEKRRISQRTLRSTLKSE